MGHIDIIRIDFWKVAKHCNSPLIEFFQLKKKGGQLSDFLIFSLRGDFCAKKGGGESCSFTHSFTQRFTLESKNRMPGGMVKPRDTPWNPKNRMPGGMVYFL